MNEKKSNIIKLIATIFVIFLIVFYIAHKVYGVNFWKPHDEDIDVVPQHMGGDHADTKKE